MASRACAAEGLVVPSMLAAATCQTENTDCKVPPPSANCDLENADLGGLGVGPSGSRAQGSTCCFVRLCRGTRSFRYGCIAVAKSRRHVSKERSLFCFLFIILLKTESLGESG